MWGNQSIAAMIFNLDTRWGLVVNFVIQSGQSKVDMSLVAAWNRTTFPQMSNP